MTESKFDLVLYDLDGTLLDSIDDIAAALNHALAEYNLPAQPVQRVRRYVGDGVHWLVERALGGDRPDLTERVVSAMRRYYVEHPADRSRVFDGMIELLREARASGVQQAIVTNKPHAIAVAACERTGLSQFVETILGDDGQRPLKPDAGCLGGLLNSSGRANARILVVGDGAPDIGLAKNIGARSAAVLWGLNARRDLETLAPDYFAENADDLARIVLGRPLADRVSPPRDRARSA